MKDLAKYEEIIKNPESTREQKIDAAQNYSGIVNYQANFYTILRESTSSTVIYESAKITAKEFFENFPVNKIYNDEVRKEYLKIEREYFTKIKEKENKRDLLLII